MRIHPCLHHLPQGCRQTPCNGLAQSCTLPCHILHVSNMSSDSARASEDTLPPLREDWRIASLHFAVGLQGRKRKTAHPTGTSRLQQRLALQKRHRHSVMQLARNMPVRHVELDFIHAIWAVCFDFDGHGAVPWSNKCKWAIPSVGAGRVCFETKLGSAGGTSLAARTRALFHGINNAAATLHIPTLPSHCVCTHHQHLNQLERPAK